VDPAQFLTAPRVTIVAGKGGVGKTTVALTMALAATKLGLSALLIEIEGKSAIAALFDRESIGYEETELSPADPALGRGRLTARALTPDDALMEYLREHNMKRISGRLASSGALDMVATATPGIRDVLILGKVKQLERSGAADVIIVDAPAAGHAISFLRSASGLLDAVNVGPIETQAREVMDLLSDPERCEVVLVTLPEETPVNEMVETAYSLEELVGVKLGPVVVNGCLGDPAPFDTDPADAAAEVDPHVSAAELSAADLVALRMTTTFIGGRAHLQAEQLERLERELPLPQLALPFRFTADMSLTDIGALADEWLDQVRLLVEPS